MQLSDRDKEYQVLSSATKKNESRLVLKSVEATDSNSKKFTCIISNVIWSEEITTRLLVREREKCSQAELEELESQGQIRASPEFVRELDDMHSVAGSTVVLRCALIGQPATAVTWIVAGRKQHFGPIFNPSNGERSAN